MLHVLRGVASCLRNAGRSSAIFLLVFSAMTATIVAPLSVAQNAETPVVLPAASSGKAIVCIYRVYRFTGSASHDDLYVNGFHLARLLNSEYAFTEVPPGTVVIAGLNKMYYGTAVMSAAAALNQAVQKENERARFEAEADKVYYFKWTAAPLGTAVHVTAVDSKIGAKEIRKLHPSKPVEDKEESDPGTKNADKAPAK